jgi:predicted transcriptional regulator
MFPIVFKEYAMTLTVRLDDTLESALERYCAETGVTKSLVVQQSLAAYLLADQSRAAKSAGVQAGRQTQASANYRAFEKAGLIGAVALGHRADKAGVRARIVESFAQRKVRQGGT